jgi:hypothetical protein
MLDPEVIVVHLFPLWAHILSHSSVVSAVTVTALKSSFSKKMDPTMQNNNTTHQTVTFGE